MHKYTAVSLLFAIVSAFVAPIAIFAQVSYPPSAGLGSQSVRTDHIVNGTLLDLDISSSTKIMFQKLRAGGLLGSVQFHNGTNMDGDVSLRYSSSTKVLTIQGGTIAASSTSFGGWNQTWPGSDGSNAQVLSTNGSGVFAWSSPSSASLATSLVPGEALTIRHPVYAGIYTVVSFSAGAYGAESTACGYASNQTWCAQSFTTVSASRLSTLSVAFKKIGSPTDNYLLRLYATDGSGFPTGPVLAAYQGGMSSLPASCSVLTFTPTSTPQLSAGTKYALVLDRSGAVSNTSYTQWCDDDTNTYANGISMYYNNTNWVNLAHDRYIAYTGGDDVVYEASASNAYSSKVIGFATETGGSPNSGTIGVQTNGVLAGFSGLVTGSDYYLGNATGTISSSAGSVSKLVGRAVSSTTLLLLPN